MQTQPQEAQVFVRQLQEWLDKFYASLRQDESLIALYQDPVGNIITVDQIGFHDPYMVAIVGEDSANNRTVVLAHMSTVQIVLKAVRDTDNTPTAPKKTKIGFIGDAKAFSFNPPAQ